MAPSIFLFQFRLLPFTACINLNFDHLRLPGRFSAGCTRDVLMIKAVEGRPTFDELRGRIEIATESLLDAHAYAGFPTGAPVFLADLETWHEIAGCGDRPTTLGYAHSSLRDVPLASDNPERRVFDSAAALITRDGVRGRIGPALADFRRARRERSTYAAYYAFRVLEEIARNFGEQVDKRTWRAMNEAFGTDETHWHALTEHSRRYRHGAPDDPVLLDAKLKQDLLAQAYEAVKRMMDYIATSGTLRGTGRPLAEDILPFAYGTGQSGTHPGPNSIGGSPTSPRR